MKNKPVKTTQKPPERLQPAARQFWLATMRDFILESHHVELLNLAAIALSRALQARATLDRKCLTYSDRFGQPCPRPEVLIERGATAQFEKLTRSLGLDLAESPSDGRLPAPMPKTMKG